MAVQTTYSKYHAPAYEGMKATVSELINTRSYFAEASNLLPGRGVVFGTDPAKQARLPATNSTAALFAGITMQEVNRVETVAGAPENQNRPVTVMTSGTIWVNATNGATAGNGVFLIINPAGGGVVGTFRSTADAANTIQVPNAKFITSATAGNLAKVSLNLG